MKIEKKNSILLKLFLSMNKQFAFYSLIFLFLISCKSSVDLLEFKSYQVDKPVIIKRPIDNKNRIIRVYFPSQISVTNTSYFKKIDFISFKYLYQNIPVDRDYGIDLYLEYQNNLKEIRNNKKKTINRGETLNFIYYTKHFVDSSKETQTILAPYARKMLAQNKDTLHIGTLTEFKTKHPLLFEKLTKNDSISLKLLEGKPVWDRITVPVEW